MFVVQKAISSKLKFIIICALLIHPFFLDQQISHAVEPAPDQLLQQFDFEPEEDSTPVLPETLIQLSGRFTVEPDEDDPQNHVLKLRETPLFTHGAILGGIDSENITIQARIRSENQRRVMPRFGIGINGIGGYKLRVTPGKRALELYKGDQVIKEMEYEWTPGTWTWLSLQILQTSDTTWQISGKAWCECGSEPDEWMLTYEETNTPLQGPPSLWGTPYSTKPIYYDDISVSKIEQ